MSWKFVNWTRLIINSCAEPYSICFWYFHWIITLFLPYAIIGVVRLCVFMAKNVCRIVFGMHVCICDFVDDAEHACLMSIWISLFFLTTKRNLSNQRAICYSGESYWPTKHDILQWFYCFSEHTPKNQQKKKQRMGEKEIFSEI